MKKLISDILSNAGAGIAVFGAFMMLLGMFFIPESWNVFLQQWTARTGLAIAGAAAILIGCFLAAIGG